MAVPDHDGAIALERWSTARGERTEVRGRINIRTISARPPQRNDGVRESGEAARISSLELSCRLRRLPLLMTRVFFCAVREDFQHSEHLVVASISLRRIATSVA